MMMMIKIFTRESSYCFQRVLDIAILSICLSVHPSVCHTGGSVKNDASLRFLVNKSLYLSNGAR